MEILIDGHGTELAGKSNTFEEVFDRITKHCARERRVVTQVALDGEVLPTLDQSSLASISISGVEKVEATTASIAEVSTDVLKKCADAIPRMIEGFYASADQIQSGNTQQGFEAIGQLVGFWGDIVGGVGSGLIGAELDLSTVTVEVGEAGDTEQLNGQEILTRINSLLEETQRAFEDSDTVEIADIVGYDLPVLVRGFQQSLYKLLET
jgi:hypothetical protein